jgi:bifunctional DNA-binding transcriptional regulator/antitoxin component of YhaV-PrlF toxin-antitoxin module
MKEEYKAYVDELGRLVLPPKLAKQYGLNPGATVPVTKITDGLHLRRPATHLAKVYIEATNRCNLNCATLKTCLPYSAWPADWERFTFW